jgi:hypothetical protein
MADARRLHRGDTVTMDGSKGTVLRVSRDGWWADVGWWLADGSYGWTKREHNPRLLLLPGERPMHRYTLGHMPLCGANYDERSCVITRDLVTCPDCLRELDAGALRR